MKLSKVTLLSTLLLSIPGITQQSVQIGQDIDGEVAGDRSGTSVSLQKTHTK